MAEVYPKNSEEDERIIYWATNNNILNGTILTTYIQSLGNGASKIQLIPLEESHNNNLVKFHTMKNKKIIRLTESDLRSMVEEAVINVLTLNENATSDKNVVSLLSKVYNLLNDFYFRWKYVKNISQREHELIEVVGNSMSKITKAIEMLDSERIPM